MSHAAINVISVDRSTRVRNPTLNELCRLRIGTGPGRSEMVFIEKFKMINREEDIRWRAPGHLLIGSAGTKIFEITVMRIEQIICRGGLRENIERSCGC